MKRHRLPRGIQLVLVLLTVAVSAALFGAVEILPQTILVLSGLALLVWTLLGNEADPDASARGRNAGPKWVLLIAAGAGLGVLQLIPLPPGVRAVLSPGGTRLEAEILPKPGDAVSTWSDLFPDDEAATAPEITTAELWSGLDEKAAAAPETAAPKQKLSGPGASEKWRPVSVAPGATRASLALLLAYAGIFLGAVSVARDEKFGAWLLDGLIVIAVLVAVVGILQDVRGMKAYYGIREFGPGSNPYGPFANRNHFATFVGALFPLLAVRTHHRFLQARHGWDRLSKEAKFNGYALAFLWAFGAFVIGLSMVRSLSRGGLATVAVGTVIAFVLLGPWRPGRKTLMAAALLAVVALAAAWPLLRDKADDLKDRAGESIADGSIGRLEMAAAALRHWGDFPVFGSGLGTFPWTSGIHKPPTGELALERAHNDFAEWLAETGGVGGVILAFLLVVFVRDSRQALDGSRRRFRFAVAGVVGGLTSVLLHELVDFNLQVPAVAALTAALAGLVVGWARCGYRASRSAEPREAESGLEAEGTAA